MKSLIVLFALFSFSTTLFAQSDGINPEIANCQEIRDPATQTQVDFCTAHAGCKLVMGIQTVCTKVKTFLNNLKNLTFGKDKIDSNDVFEAAAPPAVDDARFNSIAVAIKTSYEKQAKKEIVSGKFESGVDWVYEGPIKNGVREGTGVLIAGTGTILRGDFVEGHQAGLGDMVNHQSRKAGVMMDAKMDGIGVERFVSGDRYEGEYKAGVFDGTGIYTTARGDRIEGNFKGGAVNGHAVNTQATSTYEGDYVNNKRTGQGMYVSADGFRYIGAFVDGKYSGQGSAFWASGSQYSGGFANDKMHGRGTYARVDGSRFDGEFRDHKRFNGTEVGADGTRFAYVNGAVAQTAQAAVPAQPMPEAAKASVIGDVIRGIADVMQMRADIKAKANNGSNENNGKRTCGSGSPGEGVCVAN